MARKATTCKIAIVVAPSEDQVRRMRVKVETIGLKEARINRRKR